MGQQQPPSSNSSTPPGGGAGCGPPSANGSSSPSPTPTSAPSSPNVIGSAPPLLHHRISPTTPGGSTTTPSSACMHVIDLDTPTYPPLPGLQTAAARGLHLPTLAPSSHHHQQQHHQQQLQQHQHQHQHHTARSHTKKRRRILGCLAVAALIGVQCLYAAAVKESGADADTTNDKAKALDGRLWADEGVADDGVADDGVDGESGESREVRKGGGVSDAMDLSTEGRTSRSSSLWHRPRILYVRSSRGDSAQSRKSTKNDKKNQHSKSGHERNPFDGMLSDLITVSNRYRPSAGSTASSLWGGRTVELYPADYSDETQLYPDADSADPPLNETMKIRRFPPPPLPRKGGNNGDDDDGDCRPMADWQTTFYPNCNAFHETDVPVSLRWDQLSYLGSGSWRDAWMLRPRPRRIHHHDDEAATIDDRDDLIGLSSNDAPVVVKTWRFMHRVEDEYFELNRVDAVAMERLTSSPYVINIHGFCGLSIATEYATETLTAVADKLDGVGKLKLVRQIAEGLAHIHGIGGDDHHRPSLVHNDLNTAHILLTEDNIPRFNDFNVAHLMLWKDDGSKKKPCGFISENWNPQWNSPEELSSFHGLDHEPLNESVDIFALGNVIFRFVTGGRAWYKGHGSMTEEYKDEIAQWKIEGKIAPVPEEVQRTKDPAIKALLKVMKECYSFDPAKRPKARDIVRKLDKQITSIEKNETKSRKKHGKG